MLLCRRFIRFVLLVILVYGSGCEKRPERADVCIIVGTSSSKYGPTWKDIVIGIIGLMSRMSVSPSTTRLSLLTANTNVRLQIKLGSCTNRECFKEKLTNIRYILQPRSPTMLTKLKALQLASRILRKDGHHNVKKYIILMETHPSQKITEFLRKTFAHQSIVLATNTIQRSRGGYFSIKLGSSFRKGKALILDSSLPFAKGSYTKCKGSGIVLDECSRRCDCKHGRMVNCRRVRKEFTEMTLDERRRFIKAFKTLASDLKYKKKYEKFVKIHCDKFFEGIHTQNYFLPWHRWYLLAFENMMREVDCRITVPYWDWAFWSDVPWKQNIHIWNSHDYGLGGNGDPKKEYCVQDGPFKEGSFKTPGFDSRLKVLYSIEYVTGNPIMNSAVGKSKSKIGCLRRSFNAKPMGVSVVKKALLHSAGSFATFEDIVRVSLHNSIHNDIGGHMCSTLASFAPEFYLHHAFLDKIWFTWQQHSTACMKAKFAKSYKVMSQFMCPHSQSELIDSSHLPGNINVVYTDYYYSSNHSGMAKKSWQDSEAALEGHEEVWNRAAHDSHLHHMQGPVEDSEDDDENEDDYTGDRQQDFEGEKPNERNVHYDRTFGENDRLADDEDRVNSQDDWVPPSDAHFDEVPNNIAEEMPRNMAENINSKPVKYGETDYDFWTRNDFSIQSNDSNRVSSDKSESENCVENKIPFTKRDFIPPYLKVCYREYVTKMLDRLN